MSRDPHIVLLTQQRDAANGEVERLKNDRPALWECPSCAFAFDARHTDADGSYSCPVCAETTLRAEVERLRELRQRGCECSDEEACAFLRARDTALRDLAQARERVKVLEEALTFVRREVHHYHPAGFTMNAARKVIDAALSANPGEAPCRCFFCDPPWRPKPDACNVMIYRGAVRQRCGLPRGHWKRGAR